MTGKLGPATFYVGVDGPSCRLGPRPLYSLSRLRGTPLAAGGRSLCRGAVSKGGVPRFPSTKGGFHSLLGRSLCRDPAPNPRPPGLACCLPGANRAPAPGRAQRPTPRLCLPWPTAVPSREGRGAGPESQLFSDLHSRVCPDTGVKQVIRGHSGGKQMLFSSDRGCWAAGPSPPRARSASQSWILLRLTETSVHVADAPAHDTPENSRSSENSRRVARKWI